MIKISNGEKTSIVFNSQTEEDMSKMSLKRFIANHNQQKKRQKSKKRHRSNDYASSSVSLPSSSSIFEDRHSSSSGLSSSSLSTTSTGILSSSSCSSSSITNSDHCCCCSTEMNSDYMSSSLAFSSSDSYFQCQHHATHVCQLGTDLYSSTESVVILDVSTDEDVILEYVSSFSSSDSNIIKTNQTKSTKNNRKATFGRYPTINEKRNKQISRKRLRKEKKSRKNRKSNKNNRYRNHSSHHKSTPIINTSEIVDEQIVSKGITVVSTTNSDENTSITNSTITTIRISFLTATLIETLSFISQKQLPFLERFRLYFLVIYRFAEHWIHTNVWPVILTLAEINIFAENAAYARLVKVICTLIFFGALHWLDGNSAAKMVVKVAVSVIYLAAMFGHRLSEWKEYIEQETKISSDNNINVVTDDSVISVNGNGGSAKHIKNSNGWKNKYKKNKKQKIITKKKKTETVVKVIEKKSSTADFNANLRAYLTHKKPKIESKRKHIKTHFDTSLMRASAKVRADQNAQCANEWRSHARLLVKHAESAFIQCKYVLAEIYFSRLLEFLMATESMKTSSSQITEEGHINQMFGNMEAILNADETKKIETGGQIIERWSAIFAGHYSTPMSKMYSRRSYSLCKMKSNIEPSAAATVMAYAKSNNITIRESTSMFFKSKSGHIQLAINDMSIAVKLRELSPNYIQFIKVYGNGNVCVTNNGTTNYMREMVDGGGGCVDDKSFEQWIKSELFDKHNNEQHNNDFFSLVSGLDDLIPIVSVQLCDLLSMSALFDMRKEYENAYDMILKADFLVHCLQTFNHEFLEYKREQCLMLNRKKKAQEMYESQEKLIEQKLKQSLTPEKYQHLMDVLCMYDTTTDDDKSLPDMGLTFDDVKTFAQCFDGLTLEDYHKEYYKKITKNTKDGKYAGHANYKAMLKAMDDIYNEHIQQSLHLTADDMKGLEIKTNELVDVHGDFLLHMASIVPVWTINISDEQSASVDNGMEGVNEEEQILLQISRGERKVIGVGVKDGKLMLSTSNANTNAIDTQSTAISISNSINLKQLLNGVQYKCGISIARVRSTINQQLRTIRLCMCLCLTSKIVYVLFLFSFFLFFKK